METSLSDSSSELPIDESQFSGFAKSGGSDVLELLLGVDEDWLDESSS